MNKILDDYINSFDNILNFYYDLIYLKEDNEILDNINDDDKKELFDYVFDKYLNEENILIALSVGNYYENETIKLNDIKIFSTIKDYCKDIIENTINNLRENEIKNIYLLLDMSIFIDEDYKKINNMYCDKYLTYIEKSISSIDNKNYFYYIKLISFIIIIKLYTNKLDNNSINIIMTLIEKLGAEDRQYNMLGNLVLYLEDEYIRLDMIYDNFIKYYFEISSRILNKKYMPPFILNNNIKIILDIIDIIDIISDSEEKLKNVLGIFFINDSKELKELFNNIIYDIKIDNLDIPVYCLSKNKYLVNCLSDEQYSVFMIYLASNFKNNEIKIKIYDYIEIDLSCYIDNLQKYFLSFCKHNNKMSDMYFITHYRDLLLSLNITADDFNNFTKIMQNYFAWNTIKETDELYQYIPEDIKKEKSIDKEYREKIEKEKSLYEEKRLSCVHNFFFKDKLISDIDDIIKYVGEKPIYNDLASYNQEYNKYKNKKEYLDREIVIINPFIIYYLLIISKILLKTIDMNEIKKYIETYWDKHWAIHLYNYMQHISDIRDKVIFTDEEKIKIKKYFEVDFEDNIKDLHNCLKGVTDNSYLYYLFYNFDSIFKDIDINYNENMLLNLLRIPYYYYRGNIKLYNNYYYLEYMGIIEERFDERIDFNKFFDKSIFSKEEILNKLIEKIENDDEKIIDENGSYYILLSIIKIYNNDKENLSKFFVKIKNLVIKYYLMYLKNPKNINIMSNPIHNFIIENNLNKEVLSYINKNNYVNYDIFMYINKLQMYLLEKGIFYYSDCYQLILGIRDKIRKEDIKIAYNIGSHLVSKIKNNLNILCEKKDIDYNQETFIEIKEKINAIYRDLNSDHGMNFDKSGLYENYMYLQSFIKDDISIWDDFIDFIINYKDLYYQDLVKEAKIFDNLFKSIDNSFQFDIFVNDLIKLYNHIIERPLENVIEEGNIHAGTIPNQNLIINFLNLIIDKLINFKLNNKTLSNVLDKNINKIYQKIPYLSSHMKQKIKQCVFNEVIPVKIEIKNDTFYMYDLKNGYEIDSYTNVDDLVNYLVPNPTNEVSRILYFKYLIKDIKNKILTISHPYKFEDINENKYGLDKKIFISCFNKTTDLKNSYANWKIYGKTVDDKNKNIKVKILINKRKLIKNILINKNKDFIYYFGDIQYSENYITPNKNIKDFFYKNNAFEFENEFRVLIECKNKSDRRIKNDYRNKPCLLELPVCKKMYNNIKLNTKFSFNPYKSINKTIKKELSFILSYAKKFNNNKFKRKYTSKIYSRLFEIIFRKK
ncbi:hypothetical protein [Brachyspira pilosicoli]|uniref:hypothetical protein n=1 Tax=Brachyspira pilosicoli TaxID=52584 RepID=UPI000C78EEA9|nr:hypothetical protein [Brachyspira pilosicoli]PLV58578.1 hypothetical protein BPSP16_08550 [Brachyspira pilosicoli SP16]